MMAVTSQLIFPTLFMIFYIAILIYFISLAGRLVRAIERIADKFDNIRPPTESENLWQKGRATSKQKLTDLSGTLSKLVSG